MATLSEKQQMASGQGSHLQNLESLKMFQSGLNKLSIAFVFISFCTCQYVVIFCKWNKNKIHYLVMEIKY